MPETLLGVVTRLENLSLELQDLARALRAIQEKDTNHNDLFDRFLEDFLKSYGGKKSAE